MTLRLGLTLRLALRLALGALLILGAQRSADEGAQGKGRQTKGDASELATRVSVLYRALFYCVLF